MYIIDAGSILEQGIADESDTVRYNDTGRRFAHRAWFGNETCDYPYWLIDWITAFW